MASSSANAAASRWGALVFGVALLAFFAAEFLLFDQVGVKRHTWIYPRWNDQIQYLTESYTGYEYLREHGLGAGIWQTLVNPSAQGTLHDFFSVLIFNAVGPSRSAALSLNMLALIAWQAALAFAVARATGSRSLAWSAAALPLALSWPWNNWAGSTADFRLDHMGMCALGVAFASALLTEGFRSLRWSAWFGFTVGIALLVRFITGPYFVVMFTGMAVWLLCTPQRLRRTSHLFLAATIAAVLAGPVFWLNRTWVWNYYWIGHFTGPESAIRNPHMGLGASLAFVWGELTKNHLGFFFGCIAGAGTAALALALWLGRNEKSARADAPRAWWSVSLFFLFAPALVLTLHQQKSLIVLGALVPGVIGLILTLWAGLQRRARAAWPAWLVAIGIVGASGWYFTGKQTAPAYDAGFAADARKVNALADYLYARAHAAGLANPRIGVDQVTDCLDGQIMRVICYERKKVWEPFVMTLPTGIWKEKEEVLFTRLAESDFVFLTDDGPAGSWPYDQQMASLRPQTHAWCDGHLQLVERFTIFGKHMALYQRREIPLF